LSSSSLTVHGFPLPTTLRSFQRGKHLITLSAIGRLSANTALSLHLRTKMTEAFPTIIRDLLKGLSVSRIQRRRFSVTLTVFSMQFRVKSPKLKSITTRATLLFFQSTSMNMCLCILSRITCNKWLMNTAPSLIRWPLMLECCFGRWQVQGIVQTQC